MVKVFEIGLGRCGTKSLCLAAQILGLRATHGPRTKEQAAHLLSNIIEGKLNWRLIRRHDYIGGVVTPFWRILADNYCDAKFILPARNIEAWLRSCRRHWSRGQRRLARAANHYFDLSCVLRLMTYRTITFRHNIFRKRWEEHLENVRRYFSGSSRLLEFNVERGDSWLELCTFLDLPIPDVPYPKLVSGGIPSLEEYLARCREKHEPVAAH